jgi:hypothetical protein
LAGLAVAGGVGWLRVGWPIALFAAFGRQVHRLFLPLMLLLQLLLLLSLTLFDMCNLRGRRIMEGFVQGVKFATSRRLLSHFVLERVAEACPGNIVEAFLVLL